MPPIMTILTVGVEIQLRAFGIRKLRKAKVSPFNVQPALLGFTRLGRI